MDLSISDGTPRNVGLKLYPDKLRVSCHGNHVICLLAQTLMALLSISHCLSVLDVPLARQMLFLSRPWILVRSTLTTSGNEHPNVLAPPSSPYRPPRPVLIAINPLQPMPSLYTSSILAEIASTPGFATSSPTLESSRGQALSPARHRPHIYTIAQRALSLLSSSTVQTIIVT